MGNGKWGMGNGEWEIENGKWEMGNGKWEIENGKLIFFTLTFYNVEQILSAAIIDTTFYFFTFFARIKGYDNGRSHPALFPYFTTQSYICNCPAGRSV